MKTIYWNDDIGCSDNQAEMIAGLLLNRESITTGNLSVVDHARLLRVTNKIDSLVIKFNGQDIPVNEYGAIMDWPSDFAVDDTPVNILRAAMNKRKSVK